MYLLEYIRLWFSQTASARLLEVATVDVLLCTILSWYIKVLFWLFGKAKVLSTTHRYDPNICCRWGQPDFSYPFLLITLTCSPKKRKILQSFRHPERNWEQKRKNCLGYKYTLWVSRSHRAGKSPCLIPSFSSKNHRRIACRMLALPSPINKLDTMWKLCRSQKFKTPIMKLWRKNQVQWRIFKFYPLERDTIHEDLLIFLGLRSLQCWFDLSFNWPIKNFTSNAPNQTKNIHPKKKTLTNMFHPINFDKTLPKKQHCLA